MNIMNNIISIKSLILDIYKNLFQKLIPKFLIIIIFSFQGSAIEGKTTFQSNKLFKVKIIISINEFCKNQRLRLSD